MPCLCHKLSQVDNVFHFCAVGTLRALNKAVYLDAASVGPRNSKMASMNSAKESSLASFQQANELARDLQNQVCFIISGQPHVPLFAEQNLL